MQKNQNKRPIGGVAWQRMHEISLSLGF